MTAILLAAAACAARRAHLYRVEGDQHLALIRGEVTAYVHEQAYHRWRYCLRRSHRELAAAAALWGTPWPLADHLGESL